MNILLIVTHTSLMVCKHVESVTNLSLQEINHGNRSSVRDLEYLNNHYANSDISTANWKILFVI